MLPKRKKTYQVKTHLPVRNVTGRPGRLVVIRLLPEFVLKLTSHLGRSDFDFIRKNIISQESTAESALQRG